jgi:1,2-dihydroxy-3-keto-5-methylthiopentene dioxygenase
MRAHYLDTDETLTPDTLREHGVLPEALPVDAFRGPLDALKGARGYIQEDQIELQPATPGLDAICAKFLDEHLHDEDEVRFVLAGEGIFDIRSLGDRFMRVVVGPGDLIVVPAQRYHRFLLTEARTIRAVRLFKDRSGWVPTYR